jgi:hypothetical protein
MTVIRYGAGGLPYVGQEGPHSTEAMPPPVEDVELEDPQLSVVFEEDDTPLTEEEVVEKATKGKKK